MNERRVVDGHEEATDVVEDHEEATEVVKEAASEEVAVGNS